MIKTQRLQSVDIMLFDLGFHSSGQNLRKDFKRGDNGGWVGGLRSGGQWRHASSNWLLRRRNLPFKFNLVNYYEKQTWKSFPMSGRNVPYKSYCNSHIYRCSTSSWKSPKTFKRPNQIREFPGDDWPKNSLRYVIHSPAGLVCWGWRGRN